MCAKEARGRDLAGALIAIALCCLAAASRAFGADKTLEFADIASALAHARATQGHPSERVKMRGTITFQRGGYSIFIQDRTAGIYVGAAREHNIAVGDEVEVSGRLNRSGFSPILTGASLARLGKGVLPEPERMELQSALDGRYDMRLVSFVGSLAAWHDHGSTLFLTVVTNRIPFSIELAKDGAANPLPTLQLHSTVLIEGVCSVKAERDRTIRSIVFFMRSPADLAVLSPPPYWTASRIGKLALLVVGVAVFALVWVVSLRRQVRRKTKEITRLNEQLELKVKERTRELETVNEELEAFTHSVSHDLKAPLRAIQSFSGIVAAEHADGLSETGRKFLGRIQQNAASMSNLIADLLSFSRITQTRLRSEMVDMGALVHEIIEEFSGDIRDRKVEFQIGKLPHAHADRALLKRAVSNLISNAIKYTRPRDVARIEIDFLPDAKEMIFFVKDNGVGFEPEQTARLFQPFERLHSARDFEGSGVGLAIARRIIMRHGGRMWAEAEHGKGSTFYWALPVMQTR